MKFKQISKTYNLSVLIYLTVVLVFSWTSIIAYGHGLGDIVYAGGLIGIVLIHALATWVISIVKSISIKSISFGVIGTIFLLIAIYYTYEFTVGRGGEYRWDGNIFYDKSFRFK